MSDRPINRALISVYDKTGIVDFARALVDEFGIEIISTGGTASLLKDNGISVTLVEEITGFPELLDGRVKTLHPKIFAGILADRDNPEHMRQLKEQGIKPIDMVVVNLYPFEKTVSDPNCTFEQAIEMIDIGGVSLLRAAGKNHKHVLSVGGDVDRDYVLDLLRGEVHVRDPQAKLRLAWLTYEGVRSAGSAITDFLLCKMLDLHANEQWEHMPPVTSVGLLEKRSSTRYGENPHQKAAFYRIQPNHLDEYREPALTAIGNRTKNHGVTYNNMLDSEAARLLCCELALELSSGSALLRGQATCGTGFQPVSCATGFQPVVRPETDEGFSKVDHEQHTLRNLPHIQTPGKSYFLTFRLKQHGQLTSEERTIVLNACRFWDGKKAVVHAVVVMPDHVHWLLTPLEAAHGQWVSLGELVHSVKRHSASEINKRRGTSGALWLDEYFDRIMRNEKEFLETLDYMAQNPVKVGLASSFHDYPWFWEESQRKRNATSETVSNRLEAGRTPRGLETSPTQEHQLETGAIRTGWKPVPLTPVGNRCHTHRLETGATRLVCVFVKHTNACGVGFASDPVDAYRKAYLGDPNAAMGGTLACSFEITPEFATAVMGTFDRWGRELGAGGFFIENWIAAGFPPESRRIVESSKSWGERVRFFGHRHDQIYSDQSLEYRSVPGGMLVQTPDTIGLNEHEWKVVTKRSPTESELADLRLAWLIAKHTKSNAISLCKDGMLIGNGAGQMSRVMSCRIATWLAKENGHEQKLSGSAAASDAFFPFDDGPKLLIDAGVTAIIQPGGSKRDEEVIRACDDCEVAMIFTGVRHFRH